MNYRRDISRRYARYRTNPLTYEPSTFLASTSPTSCNYARASKPYMCEAYRHKTQLPRIIGTYTEAPTSSSCRYTTTRRARYTPGVTAILNNLSLTSSNESVAEEDAYQCDRPATVPDKNTFQSSNATVNSRNSNRSTVPYKCCSSGDRYSTKSYRSSGSYLEDITSPNTRTRKRVDRKGSRRHRKYMDHVMEENDDKAMQERQDECDNYDQGRCESNSDVGDRWGNQREHRNDESYDPIDDIVPYDVDNKEYNDTNNMGDETMQCENRKEDNSFGDNCNDYENKMCEENTNEGEDAEKETKREVKSTRRRATKKTKRKSNNGENSEETPNKAMPVSAVPGKRKPKKKHQKPEASTNVEIKCEENPDDPEKVTIKALVHVNDTEENPWSQNDEPQVEREIQDETNNENTAKESNEVHKPVKNSRHARRRAENAILSMTVKGQPTVRKQNRVPRNSRPESPLLAIENPAEEDLEIEIAAEDIKDIFPMEDSQDMMERRCNEAGTECKGKKSKTTQKNLDFDEYFESRFAEHIRPRHVCKKQHKRKNIVKVRAPSVRLSAKSLKGRPQSSGKVSMKSSQRSQNRTKQVRSCGHRHCSKGSGLNSKGSVYNSKGNVYNYNIHQLGLVRDRFITPREKIMTRYLLSSSESLPEVMKIKSKKTDFYIHKFEKEWQHEMDILRSARATSRTKYQSMGFF